MKNKLNILKIVLMFLIFLIPFVSANSNVLQLHFNNSINDTSGNNVNSSYVVKGDNAISYYDFKIMQNSKDLWGSNDLNEYNSLSYNVNGVLIDGYNEGLFYDNFEININKSHGFTYGLSFIMNNNFTDWGILSFGNRDNEDTISTIWSYENNKAIHCDIRCNDTSLITTESKYLDFNKKYNVVCRINESSISMFINGKIFGTSGDLTSCDIMTGTRTLLLGGYRNFSNGGLNGTISNFGIWNRSLSSDEIKDLSNQYNPANDKNDIINQSINLTGESFLISNLNESVLKNSYTKSIWYKSTLTNNMRLISSQGGSSSSFTNLNYQGYNDLRELINNGSITIFIDCFNNTISDGNWHNFISIYDGINISIYYDSNLCNRTEAVKNFNPYSKMYIGNLLNPTTTNNFNGLIDEVNIFDYALNQSEIYELYNYPNKTFLIYSKNVWNNSNIDVFNVSFDGTIYQTTNSVINIPVKTFDPKNITISAENYISKTYNNYDISNYLTSLLGQTYSYVRAYTKYGHEQINSFTLNTEQGDYSTTNGTLLIEPNYNKSYSWNVSSTLYYTKYNLPFSTSSLTNNFIINNMSDSIVKFINNRTGQPFNNYSVTLVYPNGNEYNIYTNSTGQVETAGQISGSNSEFSLIFNEYQGFVTPVTFDFTLNAKQDIIKFITQTSIYISIFDYITQNLISQNVSVTLINYFSEVTTNGTYNIENISIETGQKSIIAESSGYITSQKSFNYVSQESINLSIYLKNESISSLGKLYVNVLDDTYYSVKNADVRLLKYFTDTADFKEVDQCFSDSNGECVFDILLGKELYIVTASSIIDGVSVSSSSSQTGNFFKVDNTEIEIYLKYLPTFNLADDFDLVVTPYNSTLNENRISYLNAFFSDPNGLTHTICIKYEYYDNFVKHLATTKCSSGSSGTIDITGGYYLDGNYTYIASIYDSSTEKVYYSFRYEKISNFGTLLDSLLFPFIILLIAVLLGLSLMLENITIFELGMIPLLIICKILNPVSFSGKTISILIFLLFMLLYISRKENDNEKT